MAESGKSIDSDPDPIDPMRFHQDTATGNSIQSYSEQGIVIDDKLITRSVLINPDTVREWPPGCVADLRQEHFAGIETLRPGIVILGTGATLIFPPAQFLVGLWRMTQPSAPSMYCCRKTARCYWHCYRNRLY
jgi:uncharacterized protein